jgi:prepilin-type processing-associated H-X9-DG protein
VASDPISNFARITDCCESLFQFSSRHDGGAHFGLADGSCRFLSQKIDMQVYRSRITRAGREFPAEF